MDILAVILTIGIVLGFGLLLFGVFFQKEKSEGDAQSGEKLDEIKQSVEEADTALSNINSVSSLIVEEIEIKYKELLFLYQMLEEKKKEILEYSNTAPHAGNSGTFETQNEESVNISEDEAYDSNLDIMEIGRKMDAIKSFPKLKNKELILDLHEKGYSTAEIAKELQVGRGEVQLIIELSKVGVANE